MEDFYKEKYKNYFFLGAAFFGAAFLAGAFLTTFLGAAFLAGAFLTTFLGAAFFATTFFFGAAFLGAAFFFATGIEKDIKKIKNERKKIVYIYELLVYFSIFSLTIFMRKNITTNNNTIIQKIFL
jgi:membrane protein implicated in regulation of membrane protease activity